jgi:D-alanyl-D-alanine carboxypeptidase
LSVLILVSALLALIAALPARAAPFAATVMDARTGEILFAVNDTTRLHPASLTKMMTLYVVFEAIQNGEISLDTMVRISRRAASEPPSRLGLREGQRIALRHLIRAAALRSGNDAATAIAEAVSGSVDAFTRRMNRTAAAIGMSQTNFRNAHGLTAARHMSTARDMTILGRQLYFDFPQYYGLFARRSEDAGIATVANTNRRFLDGYSGADGIKTGFTNAAGYNLTAMAERNGVRIIVTVFGGRSVQHRHDQVVQLMDRGFRLAPSRAAVRRPGRPDYRRPQPEAPQVAAADAAPEAAGTGSRAAGRVIRLQTAPQRSPFPLRRPGPAAPAVPSEALLAAVQQSVETALAAATPPPEEQAAPPPDPAGAAAPARSPTPPPRPGAAIAAAPVDPAATDVEAARAAGFTVIEPEVFAALTAPEAEAATDPEPTAEAPPARPETLAEPAPTDLALADPAPPAPAPEAPGQTPAPVAFDHAPSEVAAVTVEDGLVVIPGLPPIPAPDAAPEALAAAPPAPELPVLEDRPEPALVVTAEGQVLWHDEDILTALDEVAPPVGPAAMVLTTDDSPAVPPAPIMPEVVIRASTSGGQLWAVDLGPYGSRFDAERTLLRVALAESAALSGGVRRVVEGRGYRAMVVSLTEDQASRACARLAMMAQPCTVVAP